MCPALIETLICFLNPKDAVLDKSSVSIRHTRLKRGEWRRNICEVRRGKFSNDELWNHRGLLFRSLNLSRFIKNGGQKSTAINPFCINQSNYRSVLIRFNRFVAMLRHFCQWARFRSHRFGVERPAAKQKDKTAQPQRHESDECFMSDLFDSSELHNRVMPSIAPIIPMYSILV